MNAVKREMLRLCLEDPNEDNYEMLLQLAQELYDETEEALVFGEVWHV